MNSIIMNVAIIGLIFVVGLTLCITHNFVFGIAFILIANFLLPTLVKFMEAAPQR